jgi:DNA-binding transcriptional regulator YdaS (Cro superfamily)
MRYPIFVKSLIELARGLGVEQRAIAKRLTIPDSSVSQWATGKRPIPRRHLPAFLALVTELIRAHEPTHGEQIRTHLKQWEFELYTTVGAFSAHAAAFLKVLKSPYAKDDILKLDREERRQLREACHQLVWYFDRLDQFEHGALRGHHSGPLGTPEAHLAELRRWYDMDEEKG